MIYSCDEYFCYLPSSVSHGPSEIILKNINNLTDPTFLNGSVCQIDLCLRRGETSINAEKQESYSEFLYQLLF